MKKKLIMVLAVATMSLAASLGTHFGANSNSINNATNNSNAVSNVKTTSNHSDVNVSYEFDVVNFHASSASTVKVGVELLDYQNVVLKNYGNFQLKNLDSINHTYGGNAYDYWLNSHQLNTQQVIKLDNLSSAGTKIRIFDDSTTASKKISYTDFNLSVKNATAYDNVNHAYYGGMVTISNNSGSELYHFNPNTSDIAQTIHVVQVHGSNASTFNGLIKVLTDEKDPYNNHKQQPSKDNYSAKHFNGTDGESDMDRQQILTYETPNSFSILRTDDVQFDQASINMQVWSYPFLRYSKEQFSEYFLLDHANSVSSGKKDSNDKSNESRSVDKVVDMTTLAGASKTVSFFNGRVFFVAANNGGTFDSIVNTIFSSTVEFNAKK